MTRKELSGTVLLTSREVLGHYFHIRQILSDTEPKFLKKLPSFNDIKEVVKTDVTAVWKRAFLLNSRKLLKNLLVHEKELQNYIFPEVMGTVLC